MEYISPCFAGCTNSTANSSAPKQVVSTTWFAQQRAPGVLVMVEAAEVLQQLDEFKGLAEPFG